MQLPESIGIPERPKLMNGNSPSPAFIKTLQRWRLHINEVFDAKSNEHASWPSKSVLESVQHMDKRPELARELALELTSVILEIEANGGHSGDKKLHAFQLADLEWLVLALLEGGTSYEIEGAPGVGKTLVLGSGVMQAATRLQMRGLLDGVIVYATHRPFVLAQQTFSREHRRARIHEKPGAVDVREELAYLSRAFGCDVRKYVAPILWNRLRAETYGDATAAKQCFESVLEKSSRLELLQSDAQDYARGIAFVQRIFTMQSCMVHDVDGSPMELPLSPPTFTADAVDTLYYSGDIGVGIPRSYRAQGFLLAKKGADVEGNAVKESAIEDPDRVRVLLTTVPSMLCRGYRSKIESVLRRARIIIVDEGRSPANIFQDTISDIGGASDEPPLVFMASALSITNGLGSRPYADRYSPRLTLEEAMEPQGEEPQILPNVGVDMFPSGDTLVESDTRQGLEQLIAAHFEDMELPASAQLLQPHASTSLIVVHPDFVDETVRRLREEYEKRSVHAFVVPFKANMHSQGNGNTLPPYSERVFQWMLDSTPPSSREAAHVKVLVAAANNIADAMSLTNLANVTVGTRLSRTMFLRVFGRLLHSQLHRQKGEKRARAYFRQQVFTDSPVDVTLFHTLHHEVDWRSALGNDGMLPWVPLQILHGARAARADARRVLSLKQRRIYMERAAVRTPKRHSVRGSDRSQPEPRPVHTTNGHVEIPMKAPPSPWERMKQLSAIAQTQWFDLGVRSQLKRVCMQMLSQSHALPDFIRENWGEWSRVLGDVFDQHALDAAGAIEAVHRKLDIAVRSSQSAEPVHLRKGSGRVAAREEVDVPPSVTKQRKKRFGKDTMKAIEDASEPGD